MLLSSTPNGISESNIKKVVVVSERNNFNTEVAQLLRTQGVASVEEIQQDFFSSEKLYFDVDKVLGVVLDIEDSVAVEATVNAIYGLIPQQVWCCVVGNSDSISVAQQFLAKGILYFHFGSQVNQMVKQIVSGFSVPRMRTTVNISVLGCKGGVGATFWSSHLAKLITENKKVPVLLLQGTNGSQDLDLYFDKRMSNEIAEFDDYLDLFSGDINKLKEETLEKYNFIIHDQPLFNVKKDDYSRYLQEGNNFVLMIERKMSAIRVAKTFLDECARMQQINSKSYRVFICINDHNQETSKMMATTDIESLLGHSVDAVFPFLKRTSGKVLAVDTGRAGKKMLNNLVQHLLGAIDSNKKKSKSLFVSICRALTKK
jgi:pilus assembly protein CpaE